MYLNHIALNTEGLFLREEFREHRYNKSNKNGFSTTNACLLFMTNESWHLCQNVSFQDLC